MSRRVLEPLLKLVTSSDPVTIVKPFVKGYNVKTETEFFSNYRPRCARQRNDTVRMFSSAAWQ